MLRGKSKPRAVQGKAKENQQIVVHVSVIDYLESVGTRKIIWSKRGL